MRVLAVGTNYAPEHTGIAPHTTQVCEYFAAQGAQVKVLTGVPHYPHWSVPEAYRRRLRVREQHGLVRVRRLRHHVPSTRSALTAGLYETTFAANVAVQRLLSAVSTARIARRAGARLAVWMQDLMGPAAAQSGISGGGRVARLAGAAEGWVMRAADEVVVLDEAFRRYTEKVGVEPEAVRIQPNWTHIAPPTTERSVVRAQLGWQDDEKLSVRRHDGPRLMASSRFIGNGSLTLGRT